MLLNAHFTGIGLITLSFPVLLLIGIRAFIDRKLLISDISENFHKCPIGLDIASLRVSVSPASVDIYVFHPHQISSYSCSTTIIMTLVSQVTLYFPSMIGSCAFVIVGLYAVSNLLSSCCTE